MDIREVFNRLPDITGLPFKRKGNRYLCGTYLDGTPHPRHDKLDAVIRDTAYGRSILILEQGGDCLTLESWLISYGGAKDFKDARKIMQGDLFGKFDHSNFRSFKVEPIKFVDMSILGSAKSSTSWDGNYFFDFLCSLFDRSLVLDVLDRYNVTCDRRYPSSVTFWYVDTLSRVCRAKSMKYSRDGRRNKDAKYSIYFLYKVKDGYSQKCFFGEHLIREGVDVCVVEGEKTALLASLYYPDKVWVATCGKSNYSLLRNDMFLYPDMDAVHDWGKYGRVVNWWQGEDVGSHDDLGDLIIRKVRL